MLSSTLSSHLDAFSPALPAMRVYARLYPPSPSDEPKPLNWRLCLLVLAPSLFDLVGTAFAKVRKERRITGSKRDG